jgi:hypothetical protein
MKEFIKQIAKIQSELKAPKNQYNSFGNYKYRSCEDILEAAKPLLNAADMILTISDEIVMFDNRFYVKATAKITDGDNEIVNTAFARESFDKKGMDDSQITGATSSYARKYALNGLFSIDDTKDADTDEHTQQTKKENKVLSPDCITEMADCKTLPELQESVNKWGRTENVDLLKKYAGELKAKIVAASQPTTQQIVNDDLPDFAK